MSPTLGDRQLGSFPQQRGRLIATAPWFFPTREAAHASARSLGMPGPRDEAWRFTPLRELAQRDWPVLQNGASACSLDFAHGKLQAIDALRLTFVDGRLDKERSSVDELPQGLTLCQFSDAPEQLLEGRLGQLGDHAERFFAALNTALFRDGCLVHLAAGLKLSHPLHLRFLRSAESTTWLPRLLVVLERDAQASLLEEHRGGAEGLCNVVCEIELAPGARLTHAKFVREHVQGAHLATIDARIDAAASYLGNSLVAGGQLVRNEFRIELAGEQARAQLDGLVVVAGEDNVDHHTRIVHAKPHTTSREHFRHVLDGNAHGVFAGRVDVAPGAQKTDAQQQNRNLLLSDTARMNTMPQLMIHADDVQCSHGATLGQLDDDALFYLRSRGIGHDEARRILIHAFASEMVERLPFAELQEEARALLGIEELS